ncbi:MAG: ferritin family protein [Caldimonas sp.]
MSPPGRPEGEYRRAQPEGAPGGGLGSGTATLATVMAQALAMELEAVERYHALADMMEVHHNRDVEALFRKMAQIEAKHAEEIMLEMGWNEVSKVPVVERSAFAPDDPESVAEDAVHYLMRPWHALQLALSAEQRAEAFFAGLAETAPSAVVRDTALRLRDEEREHVALIRAWIERTAPPDSDWADDPDPPRYTD